MELKQSFEKVMGTSVNMALATSIQDKPNVRVVTFAYDNNKPGALYFTSFKGNQKNIEFKQNSSVACIMLPEEAEPEAQVRIFGKVNKSNLSFDDIVALIAKKTPENAETIKGGGDMLDIYEVSFSEAYITVGMTQAQAIQF